MRQILLQYKRWWCTTVLQYKIPASYSEMTPVQFLVTVRLSKGWIDEENFFMQFFSLSKKVLKRLDAYQLYKLSDLLEFLQDDRAPMKEFYVDVLPGQLLAPSPNLGSMCLQQFMTVDTYFSYYIATEKVDYLDHFIATLYMKQHEAFIPQDKEVLLDIETRLPEVAKIPMDLKYSILINWVLIKTWLSISYKHLFPHSSSEEVNSKGDKIKSKPVDWLPLFDQLVGDSLDRIDAYKAMHCMDAFRIINRKIKEAKK
ncbi:MAG: hypothetical protein ACRC3Z_09705 [Phocaeicola sp.]